MKTILLRQVKVGSAVSYTHLDVYKRQWERYKSGIKKDNKDLVIYKGDTKLKKITKGSVIIWEKPK